MDWQHYHVPSWKGATALLGTALLLSAMGCMGCASLGPIEKAQQLVRMHREGEAIASLRAHLVQHPDDIPVRRLLVRVLAFNGDLDGAKQEVAELEKRLPNDPVPWIELGHAFELTHHYDEALAAYDTAASVAPASPAGSREGGMRCARWGEPEEAEPRLEEAVRRGASDAEIFHVLGLVKVHLHDLEGAKGAYEKGLAVDPKSTENLLGLATVAVVKGDATAALAAYDRLLARKPEYASAHLGRAWALAKMGRKQDAARAIQRAEELGAPRENVQKARASLSAPPAAAPPPPAPEVPEPAAPDPVIQP